MALTEAPDRNDTFVVEWTVVNGWPRALTPSVNYHAEQLAASADVSVNW